MFNLPLLQQIIEQRRAGAPYDKNKHKEIVSTLKYVAKSFDIEIPSHWL
jgi:hypothetical protein